MIFSRLSTFAYNSVRFIDHFVGTNTKINETLVYRKKWRRNFLENSSPTQKTLWIHGASVGELEDLASFFLDEKMLKKCGYSFASLVLSSSSPSAQNKLKSWQQKHQIFYAGSIPPESKKECRAFLKKINPDLFILSQSDLWPCLYEEARKYLPKKTLWLPHKSRSSKRLRNYFLKPLLSYIGTRSPDTRDLIPGIPHLYIGNNRIDRIMERIEMARLVENHPLQEFSAQPKSNKISIILGSAWKEDAQVFAAAFSKLEAEIQNNFELVILPHEVKDSRELASIRAYLPKAKIITKMGILLESYRSFSLAYVGGAFRTGLHNVIEPILWKVPTICGPDLKKQPDAPRLAKANFLHVIQNSQELFELLRKLAQEPDFYKSLKAQAELAFQNIEKESGATQRLVDTIIKIKNRD